MPRVCQERPRYFNVHLAIVVLLHCLEAAQHDIDSCPDATCEETKSADRLFASNLLQIGADFPTPHKPNVDTGPNGMRRINARARSHAIMTMPDSDASANVASVTDVELGANAASANEVSANLATDSDASASDAEPAASGTLVDVLPPHLLALGRELLGSEEALNQLVAGSRVENITYSGVSVLVRMLNGDMSNHSMVEEGGRLYGLETLREASPKGTLHVLDLGGNYGVVSIAAFKKYPDVLRAIVVEPIPTTYFLLRWNMYLNGIPELNETSDTGSIPGIMALNRGVADADDETVEFCYSPPYNMNAFTCDCKQTGQNSPNECKAVNGISTESLIRFFGVEPIALIKVDCEGCEVHSLPALMNITKATPGRIRRLVGELHAPSSELEDIACQYDFGQYFVKICLASNGRYDSSPLLCGENRTTCNNEMPFLEQLRLFHAPRA